MVEPIFRFSSLLILEFQPLFAQPLQQYFRGLDVEGDKLYGLFPMLLKFWFESYTAH